MKDEGGRRKAAPEGLRERTRRFALEIIRLYTALPKTTEAQVMGKQMLRSGTSVGAHYHEGIRARSNAEVVSKIEGALQELEETRYWLELLADSAVVKANRLATLSQEADELTSILVTCVKTIKRRSS
jgi:four helix bundle protein